MGTDKDKGMLQERFDRFEFKPAKDSWDRIATKLDDKPGVLGPKFKGFEHAPNAGVWAGIEKKLNVGRSPYWKWTGAAVIGLLMLGSAGWMMGLFDVQSLQSTTPSVTKNGISENTAQAADAFTSASAGKALTLNTTPQASAKLFTAKDFKRNSLFSRPQYGLGNLFVPAMGSKSQSMVGKGSEEIPALNAQEELLTGNVDPDQIEETVPSKVADSLPLAPEQPMKQVQPQEEYFPEIEIPKGNEAEGGLSISLGANLSSGANLKFANNLAMMEGDLATNSSGFAATEDMAIESYSTPFMIGFGVAIPLTSRIFLQPGIQYTLLRSENISDGVQFARHYLGLNINGNLLIMKRERFGAYLQCGLQADAGLGVDVKSSDPYLDYFTGFEAGNQVSLMAGGGVHYMLTKHLGLYAQAMATHYVYQSRTNLWTQRDIWPTAQVGLKVQL